MEFLPPEIVDKLLAVPVLCGVLAVLFIGWRIINKSLDIIDRALNNKE